jgi:bifunctional non-homologous end joining protein LigD
MKSGSSDKVYQAQLEAEGDGWVVLFQYGRRGAPLRDGRKTPSPVSYEAAVTIYDKLVLSKTSKGYTPSETGVAFAGTELAGEVTAFQPQLLNTVSRQAMIDLVRAEPGDWMVQIKHDGERRGLNLLPDDLEAANRRGLRTGISAPIADALNVLREQGVDQVELDGEDMGETYVVFDVLGFGGKDLRSLPLKERASLMVGIDAMLRPSGMHEVLIVDFPKALSVEELAAFIGACERDGEEGVVLKRADAPYLPGRPNSGGVALKHKFTETATVRVLSVSDSKRSIAIELLDGGMWTAVGNCTIPPNHGIPPKGALVEIEYLYAYPGGSLFQPVYRGARGDLEESAAHTGQLKYKAA